MAARRKDTDSPGIQVDYNGKTYVVRQGDITAQDARALRKETGFSWLGLMREAGKDFDIDLVAAIVWFARRLDGDRDLAFDDVADEITYDGEVSISLEDKRKKPAGEQPGEA